MSETIVAVFDSSATADAVVRDLTAAGVPATAVTRHASNTAGASTTTTAAPRETGFWSSLFGGEPDHDTAVYDRSLESGSEVVTVKVSEQHQDRVIDILESHHPIDMDERAAGYGLGTSATTTTTTTSAPVLGTTGAVGTGTGAVGTATGAVAADTGLHGRDEKLQLSEEQIEVGKRVVNRGTTRIRRFVVETPVEEAVTLHSEHLAIERRPVTGDVRPTTDFAEKVIEVTETDEVAVVGKTARVREEVVIRKDATDRVETVRDTVRREDVEITKDETAETAVGTTVPGTVPSART